MTERGSSSRSFIDTCQNQIESPKVTAPYTSTVLISPRHLLLIAILLSLSLSSSAKQQKNYLSSIFKAEKRKRFWRSKKLEKTPIIAVC